VPLEEETEETVGVTGVEEDMAGSNKRQKQRNASDESLIAESARRRLLV
jgi:hypothetical protein